MNRIVLTLVTTIICTWLNAQTISNGLMGYVVVNTEGGNRFELSYYSENGINVVNICDWYSTLGESGIHFSALENNMTTFK